MTSRRNIASGVLAAAAAIAASEALAALLSLRESPVLAVGQSVIRLTPGPLAEAIIGVVGQADKPLAIGSVVLAIIALGAVVGGWWLTHRVWAFGLVTLLVGLTSAAVLSRPYGGAAGVFTSLAAGVVVLGVLELLLQERDHQQADLARRSFLRTFAIITVATVFIGAAGQVLASRHRRREAVERARASLKLPSRTSASPVGTDFEIPDQDPWLTTNRDFYRIDTALSPPLIDPAEWSLRIHGLVDKELTLTYQDLLDRGLEDAWITICCVSNPVGGDLIGNTVWGGVSIKAILDEVGIQSGADALLSTSDDGWTCGTPLEALTDGRNALLALTMNGEPLPIPHGFPVRQVVPGLYGYVSATKWVVDWEVTRFADFEAYWTQRGWGERGPVKTESRIDVPRGGIADVGTTTVAGVAWAQGVGISGVEVRVDEGPWQKAKLAEVPNVDTWVQWTYDWDATAGDHTIEARATNADGEPQTSARADVLPDGATGYPGVSVTVG
ncbi:molybdopterin-dependent oxidoreductase [Aeromicrobium sp. A1-2]|uniref:molybdopterin-dependent oxidoreductase n=1 Tax=Aeromicrobium sp. A1-2 TaxID=2107713 RepID=UPI0020B13C4B|nr:molybdopterin-dependent oxidoreductase [Aeromicrobium sp. A1-2]